MRRQWSSLEFLLEQRRNRLSRFESVFRNGIFCSKQYASRMVCEIRSSEPSVSATASTLIGSQEYKCSMQSIRPTLSRSSLYALMIDFLRSSDTADSELLATFSLNGILLSSVLKMSVLELLVSQAIVWICFAVSESANMLSVCLFLLCVFPNLATSCYCFVVLVVVAGFLIPEHKFL